MSTKEKLSTIAEIELHYNNPVQRRERQQISSSRDAYNVLRNHWSSSIELLEEFVILLLDQSNTILGKFVASKGGVAGTVVDPKIIFSCAIKGRASSIILAHNHPSGNLNPSKADIAITKKLVGGGELLEVRVLDHLIITKEGYYSFKDEGLI